VGIGDSEIRRRVSTRGEYGKPRADTVVHQHDRACTAAIHFHVHRVSQLFKVVAELLISSAFSWNKFFFLVQQIYIRWIPKNFWEYPGNSQKRPGFPRIILVSGKDPAPDVVHLPWGRSQKNEVCTGGILLYQFTNFLFWQREVDGYNRNIFGSPKKKREFPQTQLVHIGHWLWDSMADPLKYNLSTVVPSPWGWYHIRVGVKFYLKLEMTSIIWTQHLQRCASSLFATFHSTQMNRHTVKFKTVQLSATNLCSLCTSHESPVPARRLGNWAQPCKWVPKTLLFA